MKAGFAGAGKVGFTLGKYFSESGVAVAGYYSRNHDSAREAAAFTGAHYFESLAEILAASDILFLTVPDSVIENLWHSLKKLPLTNKIICHCSGLLSSDVFEGISQKQASGYSVHPLFAVSSKLLSYKEIGQAVFTIEGTRERLVDLKQFIEQLGNPVHVIDARQKIKYHAAAVFLSNHVAALAHTGCRLFGECGLGGEFAGAALKTLFLNNCRTIAANGPVKALTGPVERNDLATVKKHLECFGKNEAALYCLLSAQLIEIAKQKHPGTDYSAMERLLKNELEVLK